MKDIPPKEGRKKLFPVGIQHMAGKQTQALAVSGVWQALCRQLAGLGARQPGFPMGQIKALSAAPVQILKTKKQKTPRVKRPVLDCLLAGAEGG